MRNKIIIFGLEPFHFYDLVLIVLQNKTHLKFRYVFVIDQLNLKAHIIYEKKKYINIITASLKTLVLYILHRNIHLALTLKGLCMNKLQGDDEGLIKSRHRTFPTTYGSLAITDLYFVISF